MASGAICKSCAAPRRPGAAPQKEDAHACSKKCAGCCKAALEAPYFDSLLFSDLFRSRGSSERWAFNAENFTLELVVLDTSSGELERRFTRVGG